MWYYKLKLDMLIAIEKKGKKARRIISKIIFIDVQFDLISGNVAYLI